MPRSLVFGNGNMLVTLDNKMMIRDLYYPHVGMEDHTTYNHFHRIGLWIDNQFSWLYGDDWVTEKLNYMEDTLIGNCIVTNKHLGISITFQDCVDSVENVYVRKLIFHNLKDEKRSFRVFFHQDFHLYGEKSQDTALYEPSTNSMIHYRKNRYFLVNGKSKFGGITTYTTGKSEYKHFEGTWRDAEDGSLHRGPIAQGSVDSTMGFEMHLESKSKEDLYFWMCAGKKFSEITRLNQMVLDTTPESIIQRTSIYWITWVNKQDYPCIRCVGPKIANAFKQSMLILRTQIDNGGAIIAANDSDIMKFNKDTYTYMWPRDGALVAHVLDQVGHAEISQRFFEFCKDVITDSGFLLHKYNPDKSLGSSWHPWFKDGRPQLPIQEDETALVIYSLAKHYEMYKDIEFLQTLYEPLVKKASEFMISYINPNTNLPHPSHDLWEEQHGVFTFTCSTVIAGLRAAAALAEAVGDLAHFKKCLEHAQKMKKAMLEYMWDEEHQRFYKMIQTDLEGNVTHRDLTVESSCFAVWYFDVLPADDPRVVSMMKQIREKLWVQTEVGGIARYEHDYYQNPHPDFEKIPGNPWLITTLWYAQWLERIAKNPNDLKEAIDIIYWCIDHALDSFIMPEQLNPHTGEHISVSPLTWSHATFIETVLKVSATYETLNNKT